MCLIGAHYNLCNEYDTHLSHLRSNFLHGKNVINMASNEKVVNMKIIRLIKIKNFYFWTIIIRGRMQLPQQWPCSTAKTPFCRVCHSVKTCLRSFIVYRTFCPGHSAKYLFAEFHFFAECSTQQRYYCRVSVIMHSTKREIPVVLVGHLDANLDNYISPTIRRIFVLCVRSCMTCVVEGQLYFGLCSNHRL